MDENIDDIEGDIGKLLSLNDKQKHRVMFELVNLGICIKKDNKIIEPFTDEWWNVYFAYQQNNKP